MNRTSSHLSWWRRYGGWLLLGAAFIYMFALNNWTPWHRDDYEYALIWQTLVPIESFHDVMTSLARHYQMHGGRMVAFFVLDNFLRWPKVWFNIANALCFILMALGLSWHSAGRIEKLPAPARIAAVLLALWYTLPHFGEVAVWMCGSTVYLWTMTIMVWFLLPYHFSLRPTRTLADSYWAAGAMFLLGILAGWGEENASLATLVAAAAVTLYSWRKGQRYRWQIAGVVGSVLGFIALVVAPGNFVRVAEVSASIGRRIGNQFAGNGEMMLYILPLIFMWMLAYRQIAISRYGRNATTPSGSKRPLYIAGALAAVLAVSYATDGFVGRWFGDGLIAIVHALGLLKPKTVRLLQNLGSGVEEMGLYLLLIWLVYRLLRRRFMLTPAVTKTAGWRLTFRTLWNQYPPVRFLLITAALAAVSNLAMLGAPTFPARASMFAVLCLIAGTVGLYDVPVVRRAFAREQRFVVGIVLLITLPFLLGTLYFTVRIYEIDQARMAYIRDARAQGYTSVELEALPFTQRMLRHIFYVELDNGVSQYGLKRYYGLDALTIRKQIRE
ncbi:DUF3329 domain-containing protein [Negativicoccus succinicivorans]